MSEIDALRFYSQKKKSGTIVIKPCTARGKCHYFKTSGLTTAAFQDFNYTEVLCNLSLYGKQIGLSPRYYSLEDYNRIKLPGAKRRLRVRNLHAIIYEKSAILDEPEILVLSFYRRENLLCRIMKRLKR